MTECNGKKWALWGAWLQAGAVIGHLWTVVAMVSTFQGFLEPNSTNFNKVIDQDGVTLGVTEPASAQTIANEISNKLMPVVVGRVPALVGAILIAIALIGKKYRATWFFWFLLVYGILLVMNYPTGSLIGGALLVYLLWKRNEFFATNFQQVE